MPSGRDLRRMLHIHTHAADLVILHVKDDDLVPLLDQLNFTLPQYVRRGLRPTLVARIGKGRAAKRNLSAFLQYLRSFGLQDRIGIVADQLAEATLAVGQARCIRYRAGTVFRRVEAEEFACPQTGEIGKGGRAFRADGWPGENRYRDEPNSRATD